MKDYVPAIIAGCVGLITLALVVFLTLGPVQRFMRANATLRAGVTTRVAVLRGLMNERRPGNE